MPIHFMIDDQISIAVQPLRCVTKGEVIYNNPNHRDVYTLMFHYKGHGDIVKNFISKEERDRVYDKLTKAMESFNKYV